MYFINTQTGWACGNNGTILKTTNGGSNWFGQTSGITFPLRSIHFVDSNIGYCAARVGYSIYKTTNGGNNWFTVLATFKAFQSIYFINSQTGWASGGSGRIIHTTNGGEYLTAIGGNEIVLREFKLEQNYPNPFNASSKFKVQIVKLSEVKIIVYDVLGREVATLVNEQLKLGTYEVDWDASAFPSGVYFYKMQAGNYSETKKMILTK